MSEPSVGSKIKMLSGLTEKDVSAWESGFIESIREGTRGGDRTSHLSEKQIDVIDSVWRKHFA